MSKTKTTSTTATTVPKQTIAAPPPPPTGPSTGTANPLGVPNDYQTNGQAPKYNDGDQFSSGNNLDPATIYQRQQQLVQAGVLKTGTFRPGVWDDPTAQAWGTVLGSANRWGTDDQTALNRLVNNPVPDATGGKKPAIYEPITHSYQPPDPADLHDALHSAFMTNLRRAPTPQEYDAFVAGYSARDKSAHYDSFAAEDANRKAYVDAQNAQQAAGAAASSPQAMAADAAATQAEAASQDQQGASVPKATLSKLPKEDQQSIAAPTTATNAQWSLAQQGALPSQQVAAASSSPLPISTTTVVPSVASPTAAAFDDARLHHPVEYAATQVAKAVESFFALVGQGGSSGG